MKPSLCLKVLKTSRAWIMSGHVANAIASLCTNVLIQSMAAHNHRKSSGPSLTCFKSKDKRWTVAFDWFTSTLIFLLYVDRMRRSGWVDCSLLVRYWFNVFDRAPSPFIWLRPSLTFFLSGCRSSNKHGSCCSRRFLVFWHWWVCASGEKTRNWWKLRRWLRRCRLWCKILTNKCEH